MPDCKACVSYCLSCTVDADKCDDDSCKELFVVDSNGLCTCEEDLYLYDGGCYNPCPSGHYANSNTMTCDKCPTISPTCSAYDYALTCLSDGQFNV